MRANFNVQDGTESSDLTQEDEEVVLSPEEASLAMCDDCEVDYESDGDMREFQKAFLIKEKAKVSGTPPSTRDGNEEKFLNFFFCSQTVNHPPLWINC